MIPEIDGGVSIPSFISLSIRTLSVFVWGGGGGGAVGGRAGISFFALFRICLCLCSLFRICLSIFFFNYVYVRTFTVFV